MSPRSPDTVRAGLIAAAERPLAQFAENLPKTVGDNAYPLGSAGLLDRDIFDPYAAVMRE